MVGIRLVVAYFAALIALFAAVLLNPPALVGLITPFLAALTAFEVRWSVAMAGDSSYWGAVSSLRYADRARLASRGLAVLPGED